MKKYYAMTFGSDDRTARYYFEVEMDKISEDGLLACYGVGIQHDGYLPDQLVSIYAFELEFEEDDNGEWVPENYYSKELTEEQFDSIYDIYEKTAESVAETGYIESESELDDIELSDLKWTVEQKKPGWELAEKVASILKKAFDDIESIESGDI